MYVHTIYYHMLYNIIHTFLMYSQAPCSPPCSGPILSTSWNCWGIALHPKTGTEFSVSVMPFQVNQRMTGHKRTSDLLVSLLGLEFLLVNEVDP